ncbi:MAG: EamA family transporter RarD [Proteobacteria bacterium]|nr:EamA family transporter RarD [Pseudomonadota bacterium]
MPREVPTPSTDDDREGLLFAALAYATWGVIPLYWRMLSSVPPFELTVHRVLWCALFLLAVLAARGHLPRLFAALRNRRLVATLALTSVLISINWTIFIYCVSTNQLVEASLGYYINPLISIALGVAFFGEKISRFRLVAILLAASAVVVQTVELGHFPWIAPSLALSFGFYGYFRKRTDVSSLDGLCIETWLLFPVTFGLVAWWTLSGSGTFPSPSLTTNALLIGGGPITAVPLVLFAAGARRIRLSTLGFLQYLSPSITLVMAIFLFGEKFTRIDVITFGCVWAALTIVALESQMSRFRTKPEPPQAPAE